MMSAGIPMVQAFEIIGNGHEKPSMQKLVLDIQTNIEGGSTLHESLAKHPVYFDDLFVNLVEAGEHAGALETLLDKIATYKEKTEALKKKIKKALFTRSRSSLSRSLSALFFDFRDPAVRVFVQRIRCRFAGVHPNGGEHVEVHAAPRVGRRSRGWRCDIYVHVFPQAVAKYASLPGSHGAEIPHYRTHIGQIGHCPFCTNAIHDVCGRVPLVEAMQSVAGATGNIVYEEGTLRMKDEVATGQRLQRAMENTGLFPNMVVQMIAVGEESGSLDTMSAKVAEFYEAEVDNAVDGMASLMEPMIMAVLGVLVGGMVIAMYLPIFKLGQAI